jgi:hypothetical protein
MKTRMIFLLLLIVCISCGTNNKPLSDAQKDKIKGEVKEVVNIFIKGCEEVNFDMAMLQWLDSPDFIYMNNGFALNYKGLVDGMGPLFKTLLNQTITVVDEKYAFPDNATVIYTLKTKWLMNFKDGHSTLEDPTVMSIIYKKINNAWKAIYIAESGIGKNVPSESSKGLHQVELLNKFVGNWEIPLGKDAYEYVVIKSLQGGNGLSVYAKWVTNGKMLFEGTGFWGYDTVIDKIDISIMLSTGDIIHDHGTFISANMMEFVNVNNAAAMKGVSKSTLEFITPDDIKETATKDDKEEIVTWKRKK